MNRSECNNLKLLDQRENTEVIMRWLNRILNLFKRKPAPQLPTPPVVKDPPVPVDVELPKSLLDEWTEKALEISQSFEGNDPWANITGNFDGAGLTCGALGWTIKWNNQQRLVKEFVQKHTLDALIALMPKTGMEYWEVTNKPEDEAIRAVNQWSRGSSRVLQPYREELRVFWKDPRMVAIQVQYAEKDMGNFAMRQTQSTQSYFKLKSPRFHHFAYWFDQAVLNGTGKTPLLAEAERYSLQDVFNWMESETGYAQSDFKQNLSIWKTARLDVESVHLLKLAMIRAQRSREEFDTVTMNRRGTLAVKIGVVNGARRDFTQVLS